MTVTTQKGKSYYVPADAVIPKVLVLAGVTGGKELRRWHNK